jgi:cell division protein FtsI (penicillin-binding protein 3)
MRKIILTLSVIVFVFASCSKKTTTTIDEPTKLKAQEILSAELANSQADSGEIVVMSTTTGEIKTQLKMIKDLSLGQFVEAPVSSANLKGEPGPVFIPITVIAAMEQLNVGVDFQVDAGNGMLVLNGRTVYDEEAYEKGGYGIINLGQAITYPSFIGAIEVVELAFQGQVDLFEFKMKEMSFGLPQDSNVFRGVPSFTSKLNAFTLGSYCKATPLQLLTAYNAIANGGKIVAPVFEPGDTIVVSPAMCSKNTIESMKKLIVETGEKEFPEIKDLGFYKGFSSVKNTYMRELVWTGIGFMPASKPEYSVFLRIYRSESPVSDAKIGAAKVKDSAKKAFSQLANFLLKAE